MPSIAFDCDGTLVDSEPLHNLADVTVLARYGLKIDPREHLRRSTGVGRSIMMRVIEKEHGIKLPGDIILEIEDELHRLVAVELKPVAHVPQILSALAQRGARMAVASNSHGAYIDQALTTCRIRHYFGDRISSSDRVARLKPAPDIYLLAASLLDSPSEKCIAVEDSEAGVVAAHAAGMHTIAYCPPGHVFTPEQLKRAGARSVMTDFDELLELVA